MSSLYVTAETNDMEYTLDQIFLGVAFEIESDDNNEDGTRTAHVTWGGNLVQQITYRCEQLVTSYQILS